MSPKYPFFIFAIAFIVILNTFDTVHPFKLSVPFQEFATPKPAIAKKVYYFTEKCSICEAFRPDFTRIKDPDAQPSNDEEADDDETLKRVPRQASKFASMLKTDNKNIIMLDYNKTSGNDSDIQEDGSWSWKRAFKKLHAKWIESLQNNITRKIEEDITAKSKIEKTPKGVEKKKFVIEFKKKIQNLTSLNVMKNDYETTDDVSMEEDGTSEKVLVKRDLRQVVLDPVKQPSIVIRAKRSTDLDDAPLEDAETTENPMVEMATLPKQVFDADDNLLTDDEDKKKNGTYEKCRLLIRIKNDPETVAEELEEEEGEMKDDDENQNSFETPMKHEEKSNESHDFAEKTEEEAETKQELGEVLEKEKEESSNVPEKPILTVADVEKASEPEEKVFEWVESEMEKLEQKEKSEKPVETSESKKDDDIPESKESSKEPENGNKSEKAEELPKAEEPKKESDLMDSKESSKNEKREKDEKSAKAEEPKKESDLMESKESSKNEERENEDKPVKAEELSKTEESKKENDLMEAKESSKNEEREKDEKSAKAEELSKAEESKKENDLMEAKESPKSKEPETEDKSVSAEEQAKMDEPKKESDLMETEESSKTAEPSTEDEETKTSESVKSEKKKKKKTKKSELELGMLINVRKFVGGIFDTLGEAADRSIERKKEALKRNRFWSDVDIFTSDPENTEVFYEGEKMTKNDDKKKESVQRSKRSVKQNAFIDKIDMDDIVKLLTSNGTTDLNIADEKWILLERKIFFNDMDQDSDEELVINLFFKPRENPNSKLTDLEGFSRVNMKNSVCPSGTFDCMSDGHVCIPNSLRCNGEDNCGNGRDEIVGCDASLSMYYVQDSSLLNNHRRSSDSWFNLDPATEEMFWLGTRVLFILFATSLFLYILLLLCRMCDRIRNPDQHASMFIVPKGNYISITGDSIERKPYQTCRKSSKSRMDNAGSKIREYIYVNNNYGQPQGSTLVTTDVQPSVKAGNRYNRNNTSPDATDDEYPPLYEDSMRNYGGTRK